jgi:hypothetical protein
VRRRKARNDSAVEFLIKGFTFEDIVVRHRMLSQSLQPGAGRILCPHERGASASLGDCFAVFDGTPERQGSAAAFLPQRLTL